MHLSSDAKELFAIRTCYKCHFSCTCTAQLDPNHTVCDDPKIVLHELKPDFNSKCSFLGYSRQNQTKITRCRIGHTRLTHAYLLTNEQPPFCISCNEPFTVKHFLITCTEFNYIRKKYYTAKTVKELFSDTSSDKIINFLKETNLFNKL